MSVKKMNPSYIIPCTMINDDGSVNAKNELKFYRLTKYSPTVIMDSDDALLVRQYKFNGTHIPVTMMKDAWVKCILLAYAKLEFVHNSTSLTDIVYTKPNNLKIHQLRTLHCCQEEHSAHQHHQCYQVVFESLLQARG